MYCSKCGTEISANARFCTECGTAVEISNKNQAVQPEKRKKKKKGCFARLVSGFFGAVAIMALLLALIPSDSSKPTTSAKKASSAKPTATVSATATPKAEPQTTITAEQIEFIKNTLKEALSQYSYSEVSGDQTGFTITVASDGLAEAIAITKEHPTQEYKAIWEENKQILLESYEKTYSILETAGMKDPSLMLNVVNDLNHDYILLSIINHQVVYDALEQ